MVLNTYPTSPIGKLWNWIFGYDKNNNVSTNNDNSNAVTLASDLAKQSKSNPLSWLGPVASLIGSGLGIAGGLFTNKQNYDIMKEQWHREDTAYQRAVADMKKAGLNPNLVSGGGAGAGSVASMQNPLANFGGDVSQAFNDYLDSIGTKISLDNSQALNLLRYARIEAQEILNTYAPETARIKLLKLKEELEALGFKNDVKEIDFIINSMSKFTTKKSVVTHIK